MNILLLGSGGREHALAWKIAKSSKLDKLFIAPGNAGTNQVGTNVNIKAEDFDAIKDFVLGNDIKMVVCGPEAPLVAGISDFFKNDEELKNIPVVGPSKEGAQLEGSKEYAKEFMLRHGIRPLMHSLCPNGQRVAWNRPLRLLLINLPYCIF